MNTSNFFTSANNGTPVANGTDNKISEFESSHETDVAIFFGENKARIDEIKEKQKTEDEIKAELNKQKRIDRNNKEIEKIKSKITTTNEPQAPEYARINEINLCLSIMRTFKRDKKNTNFRQSDKKLTQLSEEILSGLDTIENFNVDFELCTKSKIGFYAVERFEYFEEIQDDELQNFSESDKNALLPAKKIDYIHYLGSIVAITGGYELRLRCLTEKYRNSEQHKNTVKILREKFDL